MIEIHRDITDAVLAGETPEERRNIARRLAAFAIAALFYMDGPEQRAAVLRDLQAEPQ